VAVVIMAQVGCGHPATAQECEEIFRRSAEVELRAQDVSDPEVIQRRVSEAQAAKGDELMKNCVGNRITDEAMECVRAAQTAQALDRCLQ